jgi:hypothetical protein
LAAAKEKEMQTVLDMPTTSTPTVSEADARRAARAYVAAHLDPAFEVVEGTRYYHKPLGREIWQFMIRCAHGPLDALYVDAKTGNVIPLEPNHVRVIHERAVIAEARTCGVLPVDAQGYLLSEYARRKANGYLSMEVGLACEATEGVLIPLARPIWQFAIRFGLPRLGELGILGTLDVDAQTGAVIPLTPKQIKRMRVRADALVEKLEGTIDG